MLYNIEDFTKELNIYNTIEFKKLNNFDNYFIYEDGRVYSIVRNRLLKTQEKDGYVHIKMNNNDKKQKSFLVHRLVYETFKGQVPEGLEVDHINGIRNDNRLINLRLLTRKENVKNKHCLEQYKQIDKKQYKKHKEQILKYKKINKDKIKDYQKEYREINKDKIKEKQKEYKEKNKDKIKQYQKEYSNYYYNKHKEEINRKRREKRMMKKMNNKI